MATPEELARAHYGDQRTLVQRIVDLIKALGRRLTLDDLKAWFGGPARVLQQALIEAQEIAAQQAAAYVTAAAIAMGVVPSPAGLVIPGALAGIASDGRPLETLLAVPLARGAQLLDQGVPERVALEQVLGQLTMVVRTQVADAGRVAAGVAVAADKALYGYVRLVQLPACGRCILLAGRVYTWSDGFARHPNCDCVHVPLNTAQDAEKYADQHRTRLVDRMTPAEQDKAFGKAAARAIRDGADINQVVNARRGMTVAGGRKYTREGATSRGIAGKRLGQLRKEKGQKYRRSGIARLMPEEIYAAAGDDRDEALRLLKRFGYLT